MSMGVCFMSSKAVLAPFTLLLKLCDDSGGHHDGEQDWEVPEGEHRARDGGDALLDCATPDAGDGGTPRCEGPPGLYRDGSCEALAEGVRPYRPRYPFWSDGATKERFVLLPKGARIDASDDDFWVYPKGTVLFKTFYLNGLKLETRIIEKVDDQPDAEISENWSFRAYAWREDQRSVELVTDVGLDGRENVLGTTHDVPSHGECLRCHQRAGQDALNGFSAIQLNHVFTPLGLDQLIDEGAVDSPLGEALVERAVVPGDPLDQAALGVLHTNCGICHGGDEPPAGLSLRLRVDDQKVKDTAVYETAVGRPLRRWTGRVGPSGPYALRIDPGTPLQSGIIGRMSTLGRGEKMPPVAIEQINEDGRAKLWTWIARLKRGPKLPRVDPH
jgi:hypothetical protein